MVQEDAERREPAAPPLRVLFLAGSMEGGGSERQTLLLLQELDRSRFQPVLFLRHRRGPLLAEVPPDVPVWAADDRAASSPTRSWFRWPRSPGRL